MHVLVSGHALDQWRLRAAQYANASSTEVVAAVNKARKIGEDEPLPFRKDPGIHYYHHEETKSYFVVQPLDRTTVRVITVIIPGLPMTFVLPKTKKQRLAMSTSITKTDEAISPATTKLNPYLQDEELEIKRKEPAFQNVDEEYNWLRVEYGRVCDLLSHRKKTNPYYAELRDQANSIQARLRNVKAEYLGFRKDVDAKHNEELYRADGSINFQAAAKTLMERTEKQQQEIEILKKQVSERWTIPLWDRTIMILFIFLIISLMVWTMCKVPVTFP